MKYLTLRDKNINVLFNLICLLTLLIFSSAPSFAGKKNQKKDNAAKIQMARFLGVSCPSSLEARSSDVSPNFIEPQLTEDFPSPHFYEPEYGTDFRGDSDF